MVKCLFFWQSAEIDATDPRFGIEAALSAFDAQVSSSVIGEKNDRMLNNFVAAGGTRFFQQDLATFNSQISKLGSAGTQMTLRGTTIYDANNASFNKFGSTWDSLVDAEVRQPLRQGAGVEFNRIAGPNSVPGFYNGVVIARLNTDISLAEFEIGARDLASNVENAYWDLYFAYRDLEAKIAARNVGLETWQRIQRMLDAGQAGITADREAQAREQYFRFEEEVQNALAGRVQDATTTFNGSSGGSFRGTGGVLTAERRLRLAIGLPISDGKLLRPSDEPSFAPVTFAWEQVSADALQRRPELARQRSVLKRSEMSLIASRNFLLPRLDLIGRYRIRGLGKNLIGDTNVAPDPLDPNDKFANGSLENLFGGNFQEFQAGAELAYPIGFRRAFAAVRNAELVVVREKAVLDEQERTVIHDLSNAIAEMQRAYTVMQTNYNRRVAAQRQVDILRQKLEDRLQVNLDQLLDSERRLSDADVQFHRARVEYMLAIKNVHFEKGTLLDYCHVALAEKTHMPIMQPTAWQSPSEQPSPVIGPDAPPSDVSRPAPVGSSSLPPPQVPVPPPA